MSSQFGKPEVMQFKDGKLGAFTMQFDDSMISQADTAIPLMNERGLVGTFFVNPGSDRYQSRRETWEVICPKYGHELANHTWRHEGAKDLEEAEREIGETSNHIWKLYQNQSKLLPFARGGGTTWGPSNEQIHELMTRYLLFRRPSLESVSEERGGAAKITSFPQRAIEEHIWFPVHFHGIGSEWLSTSKEAFVSLLDFLVAHRDQIWIATEGAAYRYQQEYQAVKEVKLANPTDRGFEIAVECDESKVNAYGRPFTELYNEPLTVRVPVPDSWSSFEVKQGAEARQLSTIIADGHHLAQFDIRPNLGPAVVTRD